MDGFIAMAIRGIHIHGHPSPWVDAPPWAIELKFTLEIMMHTLDEVLQDVTDEATAIDGVSALIAGLKKQLADAMSGALSPEMQAKVDAIFAQAEANKAKIADALAANTAS